MLVEGKQRGHGEMGLASRLLAGLFCLKEFPDPASRVFWVDALKVFAAFAVVMIHIASIPWMALGFGVEGWVATSAYETFSRFAVPVFFTMTGYVLLNPKRHMSYHVIFKKYLLKALLATVFASFLFMVMQQLLHGWTGWRSVLRATVDGPYFIWYMWTLMTLYLLTPLLMPLVSSGKLLNSSLVVLFVLGYGKYTSLALAPDSLLAVAFSNLILIPSEIEALFCYLLGAWLASHVLTRRGRIVIAALGGVALLGALVLNTFYSNADAYYVNRDNVLVILFALGIIALFSGWTKGSVLVSRVAFFLSSYALWIYLVHPFVRELMESLPVFAPLKQWLIEDPLWGIPGVSLLVYAVTLVFSVVLRRALIASKALLKSNSSS